MTTGPADAEGKWTLWYWPSDLSERDVPVPMAARFTEFFDAVRYALELVRSDTPPEWIKMFPRNDERDVRLRWDKGQGFYEMSRSVGDYIRAELAA